MARCFPSIFVNSDLDEEAVVWACAHRQRQLIAQKKRRDVLFGILFALFGLAFTAIAFLFQMTPSGELSQVGYVVVVGGLVILLASIALIVYAWATDPGAVAGLVKGYWRLIALPYAQGETLLWDTLKPAEAGITMFDLDGERLRDMTGSIPSDYSNTAEEDLLLTVMKQVADSLRQIQGQTSPAAFFPRTTAPGQSLATLLTGSLLAPAPPGTDHIILPAAVEHDNESLRSFVEKVAQFLRGNLLEELDAVKESVLSHSQLALQALGDIAKASATDPDALNKGAGRRAEVRNELSEALEKLFTPVRLELEDEVKPKLDALQAATDESLEQIKLRYESRVNQIRSERSDRLKSLDLAIQQCAIAINSANQELVKVEIEAKDQIGQGLNGEPVSLESAISLAEARIKTLESPGNTDEGQNNSSSEELSDVRARIDSLSAIQTRMNAARATVKRAQDQYQHFQADGDRVRKEFEEKVQACLAERDAEIKNQEAMGEVLRQETLYHIQEIRAEADNLSRLLQQALDDFSPPVPKELTKDRDQQRAAPVTPSVAAEAILEYRAQAIKSLRDEIVRLGEGLVEQWRTAEEAVRDYRWEAGSLEKTAGEYLIPIWFERHARKKQWRLFLSVCDISTKGILPGEQLGITIDEARSRPLLEYMSRHLGGDYLDAFLPSVFAPMRTEAKQRLLGELQKLQRWNLIGMDLLDGIQAQFKGTDKQ